MAGQHHLVHLVNHLALEPVGVGRGAKEGVLIKDAEGLSVLTAWAAGKFSGDDVGMFVKKSGIADKVKHQELVIPGYAAAIAGEVEEELPGWTITV